MQKHTLLLLDFGIFFETLHLQIADMVSKNERCQGLGPGVHVQTRPKQVTTTCPQIKPGAIP